MKPSCACSDGSEGADAWQTSNRDRYVSQALGSVCSPSDFGEIVGVRDISIMTQIIKALFLSAF